MVPRHRGSDTGDPAKRVAYVITHEIKTRHVSLLDFALLSVEKVARFRSEESIIFLFPPRENCSQRDLRLLVFKVVCQYKDNREKKRVYKHCLFDWKLKVEFFCFLCVSKYWFRKLEIFYLYYINLFRKEYLEAVRESSRDINQILYRKW